MGNEEIIKANQELVNNIDDNDLRIKIQNFQKMLHKEPIEAEIKVNKQANNSRYIPISFLEMKLDEMFFGIWSTKNFQSKTVVNEEVGSLELWYLHPTAKTWLCRIGAGAVMIMQKKDSEITDVGAKIKNTMSKDYPHLKAECFRNACLSIGKAFGRDLNREFDDTYNPIIKEVENPQDDKLIDELKIVVKEYSNYEELKVKAKDIKQYYIKKGLSETVAYTIIKNRLDELK